MIPVETMNELNAMVQPPKTGVMFKGAQAATSLYKQVFLMNNEAAFQMAKLSGDFASVFRDQPGLFLRPDYWMRAGKMAWADLTNGTPGADAAWREMLSKNVVHSTAYQNPMDDPAIARLTQGAFSPEMAKAVAKQPFFWHNWATTFGDNTVRAAKFLADTDGYINGTASDSKVYSKVFQKEIDALPPTERAAFNARNFTYDPSNTSPQWRGLMSGLMFPWASFFTQSAQRWGSYVIQNPADATARFVAPYALMQYWNNTGERA